MKGVTNIKTDEDVKIELQLAYDNARFEIIELEQHIIDTRVRIRDYERIKRACITRAEYLKIKLY